MTKVIAMHKRLTPDERAAQVWARNEPPHLTLPEEIINAVTHGLGALLAVAGLVYLLHKAQNGLGVFAACVYGGSMIIMMLMSCLYHAMKTGSKAKRVLRRLDYSSIYLLIGGTFAPILLVYMGNRLCVTLFCLQWTVILTGITLLAVFGPGRWRPLHFTLYFLLGWSGLIFLPNFYFHNRILLAYILAGGLVYTLGMIPFSRNNKYSHCLWHVLVLLAAILHWFGINLGIY